MSSHLGIEIKNQQVAMEKGGGGGGDVEPATRAAGGMCDRFLTFLAKKLSVSRMKSIADGPRKPAEPEGGIDDVGNGVEGDDEFAIPIDRAEFDFESGGGHGGSNVGTTTILEESAGATTARDVPERRDGAAAAAAADGDPVVAAGAASAPPPAEDTKVRTTVTIKEDSGGASAAATAPVERKKSLFKKRQASSVAGSGEEQGRVPRRSGLWPRMPQVPRVPSNINERSSTFIEERKKGFGSKPAPEK